MKISLLTLSLLCTLVLNAQSNHFATNELQRLTPTAFALQPESKNFLVEAAAKATSEREALIALVQQDAQLKLSIEQFPNLSWDEKTVVLKKVFNLEVQALNMKAPQLVIEVGQIPGSAFFKFDIENPGPGTVFLNPTKLQNSSNPYSALLLLVHETRHSSQFQNAFGENALNNSLAEGYKAAFSTQKGFFDQHTAVTFSDFLTLNNEYEAFQFGNYVVGALKNFELNTLGFGTFASQYNSDKTLKIDLLALFQKQEEGSLGTTVLEAFNEAEKAQEELLNSN